MPKETRKYKCTNGSCQDGYELIRVSCGQCDGRGWVNNGDSVCPRCDGDKYSWEKTSHQCETCEGRGFTVEIVDAPTPEEIAEQKRRDAEELEEKVRRQHEDSEREKARQRDMMAYYGPQYYTRIPEEEGEDRSGL